MKTQPLEIAIERVGLGTLAKELGVSGQAIRKWQRAGRMPRTEWTGETDYGSVIQRLTAEAVTKEMLLAKWPCPDHAAAA